MVKQVAAGFVLGYAAVALLHGCSAGQQQTFQCELEAVRLIPHTVIEDPNTLTAGDVRRVAQRLKVCQLSDAGVGQ